MEPGLVLFRFVHYAVSLVLFGLVLFPLYAYPPGTNRIARSHALAIPLTVSLLVLASGILWFIGVATSMTEAAVSWEAARFILAETSFGAVSLLRLGTTIAAIGMLALLPRRWPKALDLLLVATCAVLVGSLAGVGHTQVEDGPARAVHVLSDALHLLGAGAWLGGLVGLLDLTVTSLYGKNATQDQACEAAFRFSRMGYVAVAVLAGSGLLNSWFLVGSLANLVTTTYGQLLLLKLLLFAAMIVFAGLNRFFIVPSLQRSAAAGTGRGRRRLLVNLVAEQILGAAIVLIRDGVYP